MVSPKVVIFTIFCLSISIFDEFVNGSYLPYYEYTGETWKEPTRHAKVKKDFGKDDQWRKFRMEAVLVKASSEKYYSPTNKVTAEQWRYVESKLSDLVAELEQVILEVRQLVDPIFVPRRCLDNGQRKEARVNCNSAEYSCERNAICYDLDVPEKYAGDCYVNNIQAYPKGLGSYSDFLLFVSVAECYALANAISCQWESNFKRPVAGRIAICYDTINNKQKYSRLRGILMHEVLHILLMPISGKWYRNPENKYWPYNQPTLINTRKWSSAAGMFNRTFVIGQTPTVRKVVREHFNCDHLPGAEFQSKEPSDVNFNPDQYAHFDERLFPDAILAPFYKAGVTLSKLDVAFLIDSGWYKVNKSMGRQMTITRGKGCAFAELSCYEFMKKAGSNSAALYPYCRQSDVSNLGCSIDAGQIGYCDGYPHQNTSIIPRQFILDDNFYGSQSTSFCPMVLPQFVRIVLSDGLIGELEDSSPVCKEAKQVEFEYLGTTGGVNSICMTFSKFSTMHSSNPQCPKISGDNIRGLCVAVKCNPNGNLSFKFGGRNFNCSRKDMGKRLRFVSIKTKPHGCKVAFQATCPNFDVCSLSPVTPTTSTMTNGGYTAKNGIRNTKNVSSNTTKNGGSKYCNSFIFSYLNLIFIVVYL